MSKYNDFKCFFGQHDSEVYKEELLTDVRGNLIGRVIITKCKNCGKIKSTRIITVVDNII